MSILDLYAGGIDESIARQARNPAPETPPSFRTWGFLSSGAKGPVSGALESAGSIADILSGFATPYAATFADDAEARKRMLAGQAFDTAAGQAIRRKADEFAPSPETSHQADIILHGLTRGVSKAVIDVATLGPVAGSIAFGIDEGNTTTQRLREKGIDDATAAKVGAVYGAVSAASVALPAVGSTVAKTLGLAAAGGPASYVVQEGLARDILQRAGEKDEASLHNPLDPLGLALSTAIPAAVGGLHIRKLSRANLADVVKHIESGGNRYGTDGKLLTSPKGAQGEMQVMPDTAKDPGYGVTPAKDGSPEELARVGRDYLSAMTQKYGDDEKALAAYNAGPGAVDAAVAKHGAAWLDHMPKETRAYVAKARQMLGENVVARGADDAETVAAARARVSEDALMRTMPDHPEARVEVLRAADEVSAGRVPEAAPPVRDVDLPQFREWFGDSKVVDEQGAPMVVYHGTRGDVDSFDVRGLSGANFGDKAEGFVFLTNKSHAYPDSASDYAEPGMTGGNVVPAYVAMKNPLVVNADGEYSAVFKFDKNHKAIREQMLSGGHDGVIVKYTDGSSSEVLVAATRPEQIKSAIGNSGKFDPNSPSLTDPLKPGERSPRMVSRGTDADEPASALPPDTQPALKAEPVKPIDNASELQRVAAIEAESPDMLVRLPGSEETVRLADALAAVRREAELDAAESDLVKAAVQCALSFGA